MLGGTFDPPHSGHLALAEAARARLELDEVLFIPAYRNPDKTPSTATTPKQRLAMVQLATAGNPLYSVSDIEIARRGNSYAVDTLAQLTQARPGDYWFILGADALRGLPNWKQPDKLIRLCRLGVAIRPPDKPVHLLSRLTPEIVERVDVIEMAPVEISSTEIRNMISRGLGVSQWLAPAVLEYIRENHLYGS